ncbi:MAG: cardiolipin synthase [Verrucomicrobiota bacterium JB023]|nr:cardiolipin synthase [Verrucomicrobiota bacterium JB023]
MFDPFILLVPIIFHLIGIGHVVHALAHVRTPVATIAWITALIAFPWIAIPFYWIFGRNKLSGYVQARRSDDAALNEQVGALELSLSPHSFKSKIPFIRTAARLGGLPATQGNDTKLLIDGKETFSALFNALTRAKSYILIQFFIVKDDGLGTRFKNVLIERAQAGVRVHFLYDEFGSLRLPSGYLRELEDAGVECRPFGRTRRWWTRLEINFRNHRKITVVDGEVAFLGGHNVGDEYMGRSEKFGHWRDTHLQLEGPAVQAVQLVFLEDWYWATHEIPELDWESRPQEEDVSTTIVPTGPADDLPSMQLLYAEAINSAREKFWIASPYFVPDDGILTALQTAALRGVDVRIMLPAKADHLLVWLSSFTFYPETLPFGIRLFRYQTGFMHQKAFLIDDRIAAVGTGNLDNRSLHLNFEITAIFTAQSDVYEISSMFSKDFEDCKEAELGEFRSRPMWFRLAARAARLLAPLQ